MDRIEELKKWAAQHGDDQPIIPHDDVSVGDIKMVLSKLEETERRLRRYEPAPKCSGCGHALGVMWVCEGIDDPECIGHDE